MGSIERAPLGYSELCWAVRYAAGVQHLAARAGPRCHLGALMGAGSIPAALDVSAGGPDKKNSTAMYLQVESSSGDTNHTQKLCIAPDKSAKWSKMTVGGRGGDLSRCCHSANMCRPQH